MAGEGVQGGKEQPGIRPVVYIWVRSEASGSVENIFNVLLAL
jgi:hypothetical protein